jgi:hypothetical protein
MLIYIFYFGCIMILYNIYIAGYADG